MRGPCRTSGSRVGSTIPTNAAANEPKEAFYLPKAGHNDLPAQGGTKAVIDYLERQFPP